MFINHKLIQCEDGYIVELYLDEQLNEFSSEFFGVGRQRADSREPINIEKSVEEYLKEKLPGIKIKASFQFPSLKLT